MDFLGRTCTSAKDKVSDVLVSLGITSKPAQAAAVIGCVTVAATTLLYALNRRRNKQFIKARRAEIEALGPKIAETPQGPIQYVVRGSAPFVLFFHGTPGSFEQAVANDSTGPFAAYLKAGIGIIAVSRPGYLGTPMSTGKTVAEAADAYAALLDVLGVAKVAVWGLSGGGPHALEFAARHPAKTAGLLLWCAISGPFDMSEGIPDSTIDMMGSPTLNRLSQWIMRSMPSYMVKQMINFESDLNDEETVAEVARITADPDLMHDLRCNARTAYPLSRAGFENDLLQYKTFSVSFDQIQCPTHIVHGARDADVPVAHAQAAAAGITGAEYLELKLGWHLVWYDKDAKQFTQDSIAFARAALGGAAQSNI